MSGNPFHLWLRLARMTLEAQTVIALRTAGLMGLMAQAPGEPLRMVAEKQAAAAEAFFAVARAAGRGHGADRLFAAALRPYGRRTRANSRRLMRSR